MSDANADPISPIQNIWAVGRNYLEHVKELGHVSPKVNGEPMIFLKAGSGLVRNGSHFALPAFSSDVHHEVEIAFRFGPDLQFDQFTVAVDLTARDIQNKLKAQGHPWTLAKSFQASTLLGPLAPLPDGLNLQKISFSLDVNGETRQKGSTEDMIHPVERLRAYVLDRFPVVSGDLILTGTPAGVAALRPGDSLVAEIAGILEAHWSVLP